MKTIASITLNRADILAINQFKSSDDTRHILQGIHFDITNEFTFMVATNGRALGVMRVPSNIVAPTTQVSFTANFDLLRSVRGSGKRHDIINLTVESDDIGKLRIMVTGQHQFVAELIEGNFPAWLQVVSGEFKGTDEIILDQVWLKDFLAARRILTRNRGQSSAITIRPHGDMSPLSVFMSGIPEFYGVLMPMNYAENLKHPAVIPEWAKVKPVKAA